MNDEKNTVGFDPRKLTREVADKTGGKVLTLDLKHKKTWFRLACPNGGVVLNPLRVTDQMAIFEARLFADKDDRTPMASFTAIRALDKSMGRQYIQAAQDAALNEALDNAGFGPEFCGLTLAEGLPRPRSAPVALQEKQKKAAPAEQADVPPAPPMEASEGDATPPHPAQQDTGGEADVRHTTQVVEADTPPAPVPEAPKQDEPPAEAPKQATPPTPASAADVRPIPVDPQPRSAAVNAPVAQKDAPPAVVNIADHQPEAVQADAAPETGEAPAEFTAAMDVEQICQLMTMEYARSIPAPSGIRKGWTLGHVADDAPASLKWYRHVCPDADNITKAACQLLLDDLKQKDGLKQAG